MDWIALLEDNMIDFVSRGPNTKRGEISVQCPFCGEDDPSQHLGISLTSENWGCLRNRSHSGHSPHYLIAALIGCSRSQAKFIVAQYSRSDPESLGEVLALLDPTSEAVKPAEEPPEEPPQMRPIHKGRFWSYLRDRGFNNSVTKLVRKYKLSCCTTGRFKDRIIIPVYRGGELIAWTGRALIDPKSAPRYLSSKNIKATVFNEDELHHVKQDKLFICEGPFDALKVDFYGKQYGARATCTFGTNVSIPQIMILNSLIKNFESAKVLFDNDAYAQAVELSAWLRNTGSVVGKLVVSDSDPGDLTEQQVGALVSNFHYF